MDPVDKCQRAVESARAMIGTLQPADLTASTTCESWDVRALINHMIGTCTNFTNALRGSAFDPGGAETDKVGNDPTGAYARASEAALQAWRIPGALEKTLKMPFGDMPAAMGVKIFVGDQHIHTWDLARALGRPFTMDEELASETLQLMQQFNNPDMRGPGKPFALPVECPSNASVQDQLVALSGRQPY